MYFHSVQKLDALLFAAICAASLTAQAFGAQPAAKPGAKPAAKEEAHAEVGPHKGTLIELGEEEYHAEFVLDEKKHTVSIYLMDGEVKNYVAIPAKEIMVTLKHDGKTESFKLKAKAQKTDPAGMSSMFTLTDEEFVGDLQHKGSDPRLLLKIDGKPFTAKIELDHKDHDHKDEAKPKK
jgi:ABC-type oligopeptide transport system substrate-binding subunit